jgi:hypothetical protein
LRPARSQPERTRQEDRHSKFYEISDNLSDVKAPRFADAIEVLTPHMLRRCGASMMGYEGLPNFIALTQMGHNQRENKTLIRYYSRAFDQAEEETAVRAPVADQITRARALYSGKPLERALKLAASA